jgi:putative transposase
MSKIAAFQFQMRCKPEQERALRRFSGCLRWVWNAALSEQKRRYASGAKFANYVEMAHWLTAWRNAPETAWLSQAPVHPQQQVLKRLEEAYKRFFSKTGGFPRFCKHGEEPGIRFPDAKSIALDQVQVGKRDLADQSHLPQAQRLPIWCANGRIKLPKLGWVRLRQSRLIKGEIKNVSIRKEGARWLCSIQVESASTAPTAGLAPTLGIDMGLNVFAATSDGQMIEPLKAMAYQQKRLRRYQKSVSRKVKGSANRKKAICKLGKLHRGIANQRKDWLHKLTTDLTDRHPVIALEDLKIKNMSASSSGTVAAPGRRVRQKSGLNRSILDAAWGEFRRQLEYKTKWNGGQVVRVNPAYTSRMCSQCGYTCKENRKSQALFACVACGHTENADKNAATNILAAGLAVWSDPGRTAACGEVVRRKAFARKKSAASVKQEPTEVTSQEVTHA